MERAYFTGRKFRDLAKNKNTLKETKCRENCQNTDIH